MNTLILACDVIKYELEKSMEETGCTYPIQWVETGRTDSNNKGLHSESEKLRIHLQGLLNKIENVDQVLIGFGYCGNALHGLKTKAYRLIIPRVDDCITLFLGSCAKRKEISSEMGTYFYTKGWIELQSHIWNVYKQEFCGKLAERIGKEKAEKLFFKTMLPEQFKRLGLIDTGAYNIQEIMEKTQEMARDLRLCHQVIPGTIKYIKKLLTGPWDEDFIIVNPGETVTLNNPSSAVNRQ